jgi:O-antigen/teichoic acid export membrane protein
VASRGLRRPADESPPPSPGATVAQNTLGQIGARALSLVASLIMIPIVTRYFGPSLFGEFSLVLTLNAFLLSVTDLGIQTIATRDASQHPESAGPLAQQAFLLRTAATLVLTTIAMAIVWLSGYPFTVKLGFALLAPTVLFNAFATGFAVILQSSLKLYRLALADAVGRLVTIALVVAVVVIGSSLAAARETVLYGAFGASVVGAAAALLLAALAVRRWRPLAGGFHAGVALALAREAAPLGAVVLTSLLIYRLDTILLSILRGPYDVGIYNAAYRFQDLILSIPGVFMASVFPLLSAQVADAEAFRRTWQKALDTLALVGVPVALGIFVIAPQLVAIFMGPQFTPSVLPLQILSVAVLLSYLNYAYAYPLIIARRQWTFLVVNLVGVALNAGLNLVFIPAYSYNAAAGITVVSELVSLLLAYAVATRAYGYSLRFTTTTKAVVAGVVMVGLLYGVRGASLVLLIPAGALIYGGGVLTLGAIDRRVVAAITRPRSALRYIRRGSTTDRG